MSDPLNDARQSLAKLLPMMEAKHAELRGQDPAADARIDQSLRQTKAILAELGGASGNQTGSAWVGLLVLAILGGIAFLIWMYAT